MNTKICTSIEQSKKLLSLGLDPSTADMHYLFFKDTGHIVNKAPFVTTGDEVKEDDLFTHVECWSLIALLELMPVCIKDDNYFLIIEKDETYLNEPIWRISYKHFAKEDIIVECHALLINAAFEMICWLIKRELIKIKK